MTSNKSFSALNEQIALCAKFLDIVSASTLNKVSPYACITTFLIDQPSGSIQSVPYSRLHDRSDAMDIIISSSDVKEITQTMKEMPSGKSGIYSGTFQEYFSKNISALKQAERKFVIENNYSIEDGRYFAIPFPPESDLVGVFFLFARNENEFLILKDFVEEISGRIGQFFLSDN